MRRGHPVTPARDTPKAIPPDAKDQLRSFSPRLHYSLLSALPRKTLLHHYVLFHERLIRPICASVAKSGLDAAGGTPPPIVSRFLCFPPAQNQPPNRQCNPTPTR